MCVCLATINKQANNKKLKISAEKTASRLFVVVWVSEWTTGVARAGSPESSSRVNGDWCWFWIWVPRQSGWRTVREKQQTEEHKNNQYITFNKYNQEWVQLIETQQKCENADANKNPTCIYIWYSVYIRGAATFWSSHKPTKNYKYMSMARTYIYISSHNLWWLIDAVLRDEYMNGNPRIFSLWVRCYLQICLDLRPAEAGDWINTYTDDDKYHVL